MSKSPSFQFYPADFLADESVVMMSNQELGCYIKLMCYCWREGSIPSDISKIARLCGEDGSAMADLWLAIGSCFEVATDDPSRLIHPRLVKERIKQKEYKKERSDSGKKGAEARWGKGFRGDSSANGSAIKEPIANDAFSSSSSTSKSIEGEKPKKTSCPTEEDIPEEWSQKAHVYGMTELTFSNELGKFRNHHLNKKTRSESWVRQWDTWCRNWVSYGSRQAGVTNISQAAQARTRHYVN